jgi:ATP-dependent RNA helicase DOB1
MSDKNEYDLFEELENENPQTAVEQTEKGFRSTDKDRSECLKDLFFENGEFEDQRKRMIEGNMLLEPQISSYQLDRNCVLETIVKPGVDSSPFLINLDQDLVKPCKTYPFKLDPFQKAAIKSIENNDSVLVAAHTSAGKTAVAEYVIAKCLQNNQRVIYTSPIKALSNQKYRDLKNEFRTVGLITGDVTLDENQTCLVMTTEILRNMLFRSNEIAKETAWVIFDEVHYMKDRDRGVIWEETIILAPKSVRFCLLSATTPNASELAQWILKIKDLDCINVIYTDYRPVPLEHYAFMSGESSLLLLKNKKGEFSQRNFQKINDLVKHSDDDKLAEDTRNTKRKGNTGNAMKDIKRIVSVLHKKSMTPAILFAFSKKDIEMISKEIARDVLLLGDQESKALKTMFDSVVSMLSEEDQKLPQIHGLYAVLKSGIGLHHGGMLPILKELVELLFQSGLIKVLVSTETFSMGINMPARSVVFTSVQKWDGEVFRVLSGSEFVQMAGRAGRRGLDSHGMVVTMMDKNTDFKKFTNSLKNESKNDPLISQFALSYNMVLNSMTMEGFEPEEMIAKSFKQFQHEQNAKKHFVLLQEWQATVGHLREELFDKQWDRFNQLLVMASLGKRLKKVEKQLRQILTDPRVCLGFLNIGRLVQVRGCGWVPFVNFSKYDNKVVLEVLVSINHLKSPLLADKVTCSCAECVDSAGLSFLKEPVVASIELKHLMAISQIVVAMPQNLIEFKAKVQVREVVSRIIKELHHDLRVMKLVSDIPVADEDKKREAKHFLELREELAEQIKASSHAYKTEFLSKERLQQPSSRPFDFKNKEDIEELLGQDIDKTEVAYKRGELRSLFEVSEFKKREQGE